MLTDKTPINCELKTVSEFVAGTINGKEMDPDKFSDIDFVSYEVINPELEPTEQMKWQTLGMSKYVKIDVEER